jgi:hypothetical protein
MMKAFVKLLIFLSGRVFIILVVILTPILF